MKKYISAMLAAFALTSCSTIGGLEKVEEDCVFSIQMTASSFQGKSSKKHGVYVYRFIDDYPLDSGREYFVISVYKSGKEVMSFDGGSRTTSRIRSAIREAKLPNIDYLQRMEDTVKVAWEKTGVTQDIIDGDGYKLEVILKALKFRTFIS